MTLTYFLIAEISDYERSPSESGVSVDSKNQEFTKEEKVANSMAVEEPEPEESLMVEQQDDDKDDDELTEDEYVVEKILNHVVDEETGELRFEIKWEGYEKKSDRTWEPEENLESASKILNEYLASVGGKDLILADWAEKKALAQSSKKGKKRGRASGGKTSNGQKRRKTSDSHPASTTPPVSAKSARFKPPTGSWEEDVTAIDACEGTQGNILVFLTWKGGHKSQHPLHQVYKRCPQKMLQFYEAHLVFRKSDNDDDDDE
ncbi:putative heterochromatin protein one protein [Erysiphe necator]|uniref:Putative heterochromatin protein one protein n=1 Tax=Uncinula necator TaxID=52586 RepID=A0A0B1P462_UNCNE|nr:putative heterochromatin protein one protein [Erysiphe necator]